MLDDADDFGGLVQSVVDKAAESAAVGKQRVGEIPGNDDLRRETVVEFVIAVPNLKIRKAAALDNVHAEGVLGIGTYEEVVGWLARGVLVHARFEAAGASGVAHRYGAD